MNQELINYLKEELGIKTDIESLLEKPKHESHGDISLPCFILAKEMKKNPVETAKELEEKISSSLPKFLSQVKAVGPFLNFYLNNELEVKQIFEDKDLLNYTTKDKQTILIEYPSPNTNKAIHIGHSRNILLGNTLGHLLKKVGHNIIRVNLNNDRGIAICKSMLSYQLFAQGKEPKDLNMKPDQFAEHWYVLYGKKNEEDPSLELDRKAQEMLVKWEEGDKEVRALWKKLLGWVYQGYEKTYENYRVEEFDHTFYESEIFDKGKDIVLKALNDNVEGFAKEDDGAVYIDLEEKGWGKKYLLRGDGTTLYMTQDIYLADLKSKEFKADKYIFVVGEDQQYHFNVLFEVLKRLDLGGSQKNLHYSYGYVYNEEGKKYSSRKGETIGADWLLEQIVNRAKENLLEKELTKGLEEDELNRRAKIIGFGALAFFYLKTNPVIPIHFDIEKALSFEGETGPYVQYTYARIQSLLRKADSKLNPIKDYSIFDEREVAVAKHVKEYSLILGDAAEKYKPSLVAHYLLKLCQLFNEFYQNSPILKEKEEIKNARLQLAKLTADTIKEGLEVLGIEVLDEM